MADKKKKLQILLRKRARRNRLRQSERGNVFFTLFGAVAIVGLLGAGIMATMRGPLSSMVEVQRRTQAEAEINIAAKLALLEAVQDPVDSGDCDADGFVEALPYEAATPNPTGGGRLPGSVSSNKQDPWGTNYGYCVWDPGPDVDQDDCAGENRLAGENTNTDLVIAVMSAGPDRTFQTPCGTSPPSADKPSGSDDIVYKYTYGEATSATGGLWSIKSGNPDTAEIDKKIEVEDGAAFSGDVDLSGTDFGGASAQLKLGARSMLLPTQVELENEDCDGDDPGNALLLRLNTSLASPTIEVCGGGNAWVSATAGSNIWQTDGPGGPDEIYYNTDNVGIGMNNPTEALEVSGNIKGDGNLDIEGDVQLANTSAVTWDTGSEVRHNLGMIFLDPNGGVAGEVVIGNSLLSISVDTNITGDTDITGDVTITGTGTGDALDVSGGDINVADTYKIDGDTVLDNFDGSGVLVIGQGATYNASSGASYLSIMDVIHGDPANLNVGIGFGASTNVGTFDDTLEVDGTVDIHDELKVTNNTYIGADLQVDGGANIDGDITATDNVVNFADEIDVAGDITATGDITTTAGDVIVSGTVYVNDDDDLQPPLTCDLESDKLVWDSDGWDCAPVGGSDTGTGGVYTLEEILDGGDDAGGNDAVNFNRVGADEFCTANLSDCQSIDSIIASSIWEQDGVGGVVRPQSSVDYSSADFLFGSETMDYGTEANRMFFDKSKGAFRVGSSGNAAAVWNDANIGQSSMSWGAAATAGPMFQGNIASGIGSTAWGAGTQATGNHSTAWGGSGTLNFNDAPLASGEYSTAWGDATTASGSGATAFGFGTTASGQQTLALGMGVEAEGLRSVAFGFNSSSPAVRPKVSGDRSMALFFDEGTSANNSGLDITGTDLFAVIGGQALIDPTRAEVDTSIGGEQDLTLDVHGAVGGEFYCDEDGDFCFTAEDFQDGNIWSEDGTNNYIEYDDILGGVRIGKVTGQPEPESDWVLDVASSLVYTNNDVAIGGSSVSSGDQTLILDVSGPVGATHYCDANGDDCFVSSDVTDATSIWEDVAGDGSGPIRPTSGVVNYASADFLFGSPTADYDSDPNHAMRMFLDKSKWAFRAGYTTDDSWNEGNIGNWSAAFGYNTRATNSGAMAMGFSSTASGRNSMAWGGAFVGGLDGGTASGDTSTAWGIETIAGGGASTAWGYSTAASGAYATAWGLGADASGTGATAWGNNTTASGDYATAFGRNVVAAGRDSTAIGYGVTVSGANSVGFGLDVDENGLQTVSGDNSFAIFMGNQIGVDVSANDIMALLGGRMIIDPGQDASQTNVSTGDVELELDVEGQIGAIQYCDQAGFNCFAPGDVSGGGGGLFEKSGIIIRGKSGPINYSTDDFVFGSPTLAYSGTASEASRFFFDKDESAFRAGYEDGGQWNPASMGQYSVAFGYNTEASGSVSTAMGEYTTASGYGSTAIGGYTTASGSGSTAMGTDTIASGDYSTAIGDFTTASGYGSMAMGSLTIASGDYATAWGTESQATGNYATAWGDTSTASGEYSTAFGYESVANGDYATAWGYESVATGDYSTAWGQYTEAFGNYSTAMGIDTVAGGDHSTAMGRLTDSTGGGAMAWGYSTTASGSYATALGNGNIASGNYSFSGGAGNADVSANDASGLGAFAWGTQLISSGSSSFAGGIDTTASGNYSFAYGYSAVASGSSSTAFGESTLASGQRATTWGMNTTATQTNATAWGNGADATGIGATAWGNNTTASGQYATAFGRNVVAAGRDSTAIGYGVTVSGANSVGFGLDVDENGLQTVSGDNSFAIFMGNQIGVDVSANDIMALLGGRMIIDPGQDASQTNVSTGDVQLELDVEGQIGAIQYCDEDGFNCFAPGDVSGGGGGLFEKSGIVIRGKSGPINYSTDDFVFGSPQLADDGNADHRRRFFFDKDLGAFRAGYEDGGQWNPASMGQYSAAFNRNTTASGWGAAAFGLYTTASGDMSTAFGFNSTTSSEGSMAWGGDSFIYLLDGGTASGRASTAFGGGTTASGPLSTAFGRETTATHEYATAWGYGADATGVGATAWGRNSTASGDYATAFGAFAQATGDYSIATGIATTASGLESFSTGALTIASGNNSFAHGESATATAANSTAWGLNSNATGIGATAWGTGTTASGQYATAFGVTTAATANYSFAHGESTTATGSSSTAQGQGSDATGASSFASGQNATASGIASTALGAGTTASAQYATAFGNGADATGTGATAWGSNTTASGQYATAWGDNTTASGNQATAFGTWTEANGHYSIASGAASYANGETSFAHGYHAFARGDGSVAIGGTPATGEVDVNGRFSMGFGTYVDVDGDSSYGMGTNVTASGNRSYAFGSQVFAGSGTAGDNAGDYSVAWGLQSETQTSDPKVTGARSMALFFDGDTQDANSGYEFDEDDKFALIGGEFQIDDQSSTANKGCIKYDSASSKLQFSHDCSVGVPTYYDMLDSGSLGSVFEVSGTTVRGVSGIVDYSTDDFVFGSPQLNDIGGETYDNARMFFDKDRAAFRAGSVTGGEWDVSNIASGSAAFGYNTTAEGNQSTAFGYQSTASGGASTAFGSNTVASGNDSTAWGSGADAIGTGATAWGSNTTASGQYATAFGGAGVIGNVQSTGYASTAWGGDAVASGDYSTAWGAFETVGGPVASGYASTAWGSSTASNNQTTAWGTGATASGWGATAWGGDSSDMLGGQAIGENSTAWGNGASATGVGATAWGENTTASGLYATAWGFADSYDGSPKATARGATAWGTGTVASGISSTAWGGVSGTDANPVASGQQSTAWGHTSVASGFASTAWGGSSLGAVTASGSLSTAWGSETTASGGNSTAFGRGTQATASYSTAWGRNTTASGQYSTAFGNGGEASGESSLSGGAGSFALGYASVALGDNAEASGYGGIAMGREVTSTGGGSFALGLQSAAQTDDPIVSGTSSFGIFMDGGSNDANTGYDLTDSNALALIGGEFQIDDQSSTANKGCIKYDSASGKLQFSHDCSVGVPTYSDFGSGGGGAGVFEVSGTTVRGVSGTTNYATDDFVFGAAQLANVAGTGDDSRMFFDKDKGAFRAGFGQGTEWDDGNVGVGSVAFGRGNLIGASNIASGESSMTWGGHSLTDPTNTASARNATAFGSGTTASGEWATAFGNSTTASAFQSTAWGVNTNATGAGATAWGSSTNATGAGATAWGFNTTASGQYATAFGSGSVAGGDYSAALGFETNATGAVSFAVGASNTASGDVSATFGTNTTATADNTMAWGNGADATGTGATAWGTGSTASGQYATAFGNGNVASGDYSVTWGPNGEGTTTASGRGSTAWGYGTIASGDGATTWGGSTTAAIAGGTATGLGTTAFGWTTTASGSAATAFGLSTTATGNYATAWGEGADATGQGATAWGNTTTASGQYATAFGNGSIASGDYSMAWGTGTVPKTTASGLSSTAFGAGSVASGSVSLAFGQLTTASAMNSTSWGQYSAASGDMSTAFGTTTIASGAASLAFGGRVTAGSGTGNDGDGDFSIAVGLQSADFIATPPTVTGDRSMVLFFDAGVDHANSTYDFTETDKFALIGGEFQIDDQSSTANKGCIKYDSGSGKLQFSHDCSVGVPTYSDFGSGGGGAGVFEVSGTTVRGVSGTTNYATDDFVFGSTSLNHDGNNDHARRMFFDKSKGAFRAGLAADPALAYDGSTDRWDDTNVGTHSAAFGWLTMASGEGSFAYGENSQVTGGWSLAGGTGTNVSGGISIGVGGGVNVSGDWSAAFGRGTTATQNFTMAWGNGSDATGLGATAWGDNTTASGQYATAIGKDTISSGDYSFAGGDETTASGEASFAFGGTGSGNAPVASGTYSAAWGGSGNATGPIASGDFATAWGGAGTSNGGNASGTGATAFGTTTTASGNYATAWGNGAIASGQYATAWGDNTDSTGLGSTAWGTSSEASGDYSTAFGGGRALAHYSTAFGTSGIANGENSLAFGTGAIALGDHSFAGGSTATASSQYSFAFGQSTTATGISSIAMGRSTTNGDYSTALGRATASADYATATGQSVASGQYSVALGFSATASGGSSLAAQFGKAEGLYSVSIGQNTEASGQNAVAFGRQVLVGNGTAGSNFGDYSVAFGLNSNNQATDPRVTGDRSAVFFFDGGVDDTLSTYDFTESDKFALIGGEFVIGETQAQGAAMGCIKFDEGSDKLQWANDCSSYNDFGGGSGLWEDSGSGYIFYSAALGAARIASVSGADAPTLPDFTFTGGGGGSSLWTQSGSDIYYDTGRAVAGTTDATLFDNGPGGGTLSSLGDISALAIGNGAATDKPDYDLLRARGTTGSRLKVEPGDTLGTLRFNGWDGNSYETAAQIKADVHAATGDEDVAGRLSFLTRLAGATGAVEHMVIDDEGAIFIGDTTETGEEVHIGPLAEGSSDTAISMENNSHVFELHVQDDNKFGITDEDENHYLTIDGSNGYVGIGTETPARLLHMYDPSIDVIIEGDEAGEAALAIITKGNETDNWTEAATNGWAWLGYGTSNAGNTDKQDDLQFMYYEGTVGTDVMFFEHDTGYIGMGTTEPQTELHLADATGGVGIMFTNADGDGSKGQIHYDDDDDGFNFRVNDGTDAMHINYSGNVGIGTLTPNVALDVNGSIEYTGTITDVSDIRLKTDIDSLIERGSMLAKLDKIDTYSFVMKDDPDKRVEFGVMAQELEGIFPELVHTADDEMGTKSVNYVGLIAPMIEATQELKAENDALKAELATLKASNDNIHEVVASLSDQVELLNKTAGNNVNKASFDFSQNWIMLLLGLMGGVTFMVILSNGRLRKSSKQE